jgi:hypothetical protein
MAATSLLPVKPWYEDTNGVTDVYLKEMAYPRMSNPALRSRQFCPSPPVETFGDILELNRGDRGLFPDYERGVAARL